MKTWLVHPVFVAALVTGLNALKPVAVDDTAYLLLARQIAVHPLDPYGGELFWYAEPQPALHVLAPPVVPYWLAIGIRLFGEHVPPLKLWLFPFPLILCYAVRSLARRFAPGYDDLAVPAVAFSPFVLPLFGVMLDVPALALGLMALSVFVRGDRYSWLWSGLLAGLAMQTKYTAVVAPGAVLWFGLTHRRVVPAGLACLIAAIVFAGWEGLMFAEYGESHFLYHAGDQRADGHDGLDFVGHKFGRLALPLLIQCGGLGFGFALLAVSAVGMSRLAAWAAVVSAAGITAILLLPYSRTVFLSDANGHVMLDLPGLLFSIQGVVFLSVLFGWSLLSFRQSPDRTVQFLAGWLFLEMAAYFALSPFPASRRVMGIGVVAAFMILRAIDRLTRTYGMRPAAWVWAYGFAFGLGLFALDTWDARAEKVLAEDAARFVRERGGGRTWFNGHWGFQYYCDREGMVPVVPGKSRLDPGDWLVFPVVPDDEGFYRPYHGGAKFRPDPHFLTPEMEFTWLDGLSGQTIPTLYGGRYPVTGRDHPRLRVVVYRVTHEWVPERLD